jgi:hypothetical protein
MTSARAIKILEKPRAIAATATPMMAIAMAGLLPRLSARRPPRIIESIPPTVRMESRRPTSSTSKNEPRYSERKLYHNMVESTYRELRTVSITISTLKTSYDLPLTGEPAPKPLPLWD